MLLLVERQIHMGTKIVSMAKQMDDENRGDVSSTRAEHQQLKFEVTTVDT
jgi:hypothetical protein